MLCPKTVLIIGANRGIGLEFVRCFLNLETRPNIIFACCRQPNSAKELGSIAKQHPSLHILKLDVADQSTIDAAKSAVESKVGDQGLNLLINNAGIFSRTEFPNITREEMREVYEVNTVGPMMMTQTFYPLLRQAASQSKDAPMSCNRAAVINISSDLGSITENTFSQYNSYRAAKVALNMLTKSLSLDMKGDGILCSAIHPGWVQTDMGGPSASVTTETSLQKIMPILEKLQGTAETGKFYHALRGEEMAW